MIRAVATCSVKRRAVGTVLGTKPQTRSNAVTPRPVEAMSGPRTLQQPGDEGLNIKTHGADGADTSDDFQRVDDFLPLLHALSLLKSVLGVVVDKGIFIAAVSTAVSAAMTTTSERLGSPHCEFMQSCGSSHI
jgi:hypothetical protein